MKIAKFNASRQLQSILGILAIMLIANCSGGGGSGGGDSVETNNYSPSGGGSGGGDSVETNNYSPSDGGRETVTCVDWQTTTAPTCKTEGARTKTCSDGATKTETIPKLEWKAWEQTIAPTCTASGSEKRDCPNGDTETSVLAPLDGNWETTKHATCDAEGEKSRCINGVIEKESITKLAWGAYQTKTPATCDAAGFEERECPNGEKGTRVLTQLAWGNWTVTTASTKNCPNNAQPAQTRQYSATSPYNQQEQLCDARDDKRYKHVTIGTQTWMAENLNYDHSGSKCYDDIQNRCNIYGRLYDWENARTVCPSGWHLPTQAEWNILSSYVQSSNGCATNCDAKHLKAISGWSDNFGQSGGLDTYGFAALPGGDYTSSFGSSGAYGYWWSDTEYLTQVYYKVMFYKDDNSRWLYNWKSCLYSVRCLKD